MRDRAKTSVDSLGSFSRAFRSSPWFSRAFRYTGRGRPVALVFRHNYTTVSITVSSFSDESCFVWPFLSDPWFISGVLNPKAKLNKLSLRNEPFWMTGALSACLFSRARWRSSFLCLCRRTCIRREQLTLKIVTILDISTFNSSLCLVNSTRLGSREWHFSVPVRESNCTYQLYRNRVNVA